MAWTLSEGKQRAIRVTETALTRRDNGLLTGKRLACGDFVEFRAHVFRRGGFWIDLP